MPHTPGPWAANLDREFILGGDTVCVVALAPDGVTVKREVASCMLDTDSSPDGAEWLEDVANARLIAASPDLLAACREVLAWASHSGAFCEREDKEVLAQVVAAVEKATNQEMT